MGSSNHLICVLCNYNLTLDLWKSQFSSVTQSKYDKLVIETQKLFNDSIKSHDFSVNVMNVFAQSLKCCSFNKHFFAYLRNSKKFKRKQFSSIFFGRILCLTSIAAEIEDNDYSCQCQFNYKISHYHKIVKNFISVSI